MRPSLAWLLSLSLTAWVAGGAACGSSGGGDARGALPSADGGEGDAAALEDSSPTPADAPSPLVATNETVEVMGATRRYVLVVPRGYDAARRYPLLIALHGDGDDGPGFRASLDLDALAGDDAVVAYPTGAVDLFTPYDQNPDQQLIEATIRAVEARYSIDPARVWGFGYSKGGFMANEIGCRRPGVWKAMAIHAGGAPQEPQSNGFPVCPGVIGLPVLATEGELDQGIGGAYGAQYWAHVNGCSAQRSATTPAPCEAYDGCPSGKPVVYCLAPGVSHYPLWSRATAISWAWLRGL